MSVRTLRSEFQEVNLRNVQPRACFDTLGGTAGKKLSDLKKITPYTTIDFSNERFSAAENLNEQLSSALDEWQELVKSLADQTSTRFLRVDSLATLVGFPKAERYSATLSRELSGAIAARGYAIEPDARFGAPPYKATDEIAIFRPINSKVTASYVGAAALLQLCVMIAAADDQIEELEMKVAHDFIAQNASLDAGDLQRLAVLEILLCRNPDMSKRSLKRFAKRLSIKQRELIGEVLVYVAGADGKITSGEWAALDRSFKALDLPTSALDDTLNKLGAHFEEPIIQEAETGLPGEKIPDVASNTTATARHEFTIDMSKVAKISHETSEVIGILSAVMCEDENGANPTSTTQSIPVAVAPSGMPSLQEDGANRFNNLNATYQPIIARLITKANWSQSEFNQVSSEFKLMPLAVFDALNEWSDEHLGDFLLDGEDPIKVNRELLPKEFLT